MEVCYSSAPLVEKECGAGEEEIGDSQEPLRIILKIYHLSISYSLKKIMYNFISITTFMETTSLVMCSYSYCLSV